LCSEACLRSALRVGAGGVSSLFRVRVCRSAVVAPVAIAVSRVLWSLVRARGGLFGLFSFGAWVGSVVLVRPCVCGPMVFPPAGFLLCPCSVGLMVILGTHPCGPALVWLPCLADFPVLCLVVGASPVLGASRCPCVYCCCGWSVLCLCVAVSVDSGAWLFSFNFLGVVFRSPRLSPARLARVWCFDSVTPRPLVRPRAEEEERRKSVTKKNTLPLGESRPEGCSTRLLRRDISLVGSPASPPQV